MALSRADALRAIAAVPDVKVRPHAPAPIEAAAYFAQRAEGQRPAPALPAAGVSSGGTGLSARPAQRPQRGSGGPGRSILADVLGEPPIGAQLARYLQHEAERNAWFRNWQPSLYRSGGGSGALSSRGAGASGVPGGGLLGMPPQIRGGLLGSPWG